MCFLPCASRQGRPFWPPAGDHEGRPYGAFAPIRKDWEARMAYHILLVDDAPELRRMVGELLEGAGYAVTLAADCAQARRAWTESQPDAALLDVMLPDGDGFSLLEELRRVGNCVPVPQCTSAAPRRSTSPAPAPYTRRSTAARRSSSS